MKPSTFHPGRDVKFTANHGQWQDPVVYAAELGGFDQLYLEEDAFTYVLHDPADVADAHDLLRVSGATDPAQRINGHVYRVRFAGATTTAISGSRMRSAFNNYFLGDDESQWVAGVPVYGKLRYRELYPATDLIIYAKDGHLKYDLVVEPGGEPENIQLEYEGVDAIFLDEGDLVIETSVQTVRELAPFAFQRIDGEKKRVACHYVLDGQKLGFAFPDGYDRDLPLVIDPTVIVSTLSGTFNNQNFGHSATYDNAGNIYTAGISFGPGYPATTGAFQTNFAGGNTDIAISKYNPDGSELIYATYIGGSGPDYPHSTITDADGRLVVYGNSQSFDYPTTATAFQPNIGGFTDIIVTKLNPNGSGLIGSTFLGGGDMDGLNEIEFLNSSFGEQYRGEIILDAADNVYIASCTRSNNFPVTAGALQSSLTIDPFGFNSQDGVLCCLSPDLSALNWSTYLGGQSDDLCSGLRVKENGNVYVCGTATQNFPMTGGGLIPAWPGGESSTFIAEISSDGTQMVNGTYWGTDNDDYGYFIDVDEDDQVHLFGLTFGELPITAGTYASAVGSHQFFAGFGEELNSLVYSTVFGIETPSPIPDFTPNAFMVDRCNGIYFSGYYTNPGLPLTDDALTTEDNSFYLGVLEPNATGLIFGSYYGGADHVDGGTSRFDKAGIVYQAVCSCTFTNAVLTTTPGAFATTQSTSCDVGVFKIDFEVDVVTASASISPLTSGCAPYVVDFSYTGEDAVTVSWDFGDDATSNSLNPTHTFEEPGVYTVTQIVENLNSCNLRDTFEIDIEVFPSQDGTQTDLTLCPESELLLDATTANADYTWQDGSTEATFTVTEPGVYWVNVSINAELCGRVDSFIVDLSSELSLDLGTDTVYCDVAGIALDASNNDAVSYAWQDGSGNPVFAVNESGTYSVQLNDANGCQLNDTVVINLATTPDINLGPDIFTCNDPPILLEIAAGFEYSWQDGSTAPSYSATESGVYFVAVDNDGCLARDTIEIGFVSSPVVKTLTADVSCAGEQDGSIDLTLVSATGTVSYDWSNGATQPALSALAAGTYVVSVSDESDCVRIDTFEIVEPGPLSFSVRTTDPVCNDGIITIGSVAGGSPAYAYRVGETSLGQDTILMNLGAGTYLTVVEDANGCRDSLEVALVNLPGVIVDAGRDQTIRLGDSIRLNPQFSTLLGQALDWSPAQTLSCPDCPFPFARPTDNVTYFLRLVDTTRGCIVTDEVAIFVDRSRRVFIPNAFSPNNDGVNDRFLVFSDGAVANIVSLRIYNRWGGLLHEAFDLRPNEVGSGWDGRQNGRLLDPQVVVYTCVIEFIDGRTELFKGDLTVIR